MRAHCVGRAPGKRNVGARRGRGRDADQPRPGLGQARAPKRFGKPSPRGNARREERCSLACWACRFCTLPAGRHRRSGRPDAGRPVRATAGDPAVRVAVSEGAATGPHRIAPGRDGLIEGDADSTEFGGRSGRGPPARRIHPSQRHSETRVPGRRRKTWISNRYWQTSGAPVRGGAGVIGQPAALPPAC